MAGAFEEMTYVVWSGATVRADVWLEVVDSGFIAVQSSTVILAVRGWIAYCALFTSYPSIVPDTITVWRNVVPNLSILCVVGGGRWLMQLYFTVAVFLMFFGGSGFIRHLRVLVDW